MKILLITLLTVIAALSLSAAEPATITFNAPIASPQRTEDGWRWFWKWKTENWQQFTTNTVGTNVVVVDNGPVPTLAEFCKQRIQQTFDAHGEHYYQSMLAANGDRAKSKQIRTVMDQLANSDVDLLYRIALAVSTNSVAVSNAVSGVIP